jgi:hypothetical protein
MSNVVEILCRIFQGSWAEFVMFTEKQDFLTPSTRIEDEETGKTVITKIFIYPFTSYQNIAEKVLILQKVTKEELGVIYFRDNNKPTHFCIYHKKMHSYGNFDVLETDLEEIAEHMGWTWEQ